MRALFELQALVEPGAAAMACYGLDTTDRRAADRDFHNAMLRATRNDYLIALSSSIGTAVALTTQFKQRQRALPCDPIPDHRTALDAIADSDPLAASAAMQVLVERVLEDTQQAM